MIIRSSNKQRSDRKKVFFVLQSRFQMGIEPTVRNFLLFVSLFSSFFLGLFRSFNLRFSLLQKKTNLEQEKEKRGMSKMEASDRPEWQLSSSSWAERKMDH